MSARKTLGILVISLVLSGCGVLVRSVSLGFDGIRTSSLFVQGKRGNLTEKEIAWAKIAWRYFKNNTNVESGAVNSIDAYPSFTMSTVADYIAAMISARKLGIIEKKEFDHRVSSLLHFLNTMELFQGRLPNKIYHAKNSTMTTYDGSHGEIGWSAIDIGRLLIWLKILSIQYVEFHEYVDKAVMRWNFCDVIDEEGSLYAGDLHNGDLRIFQEGRLGYEEYAAIGFRAWGFEPTKAEELDPVELITIYDIDIYHDARDHRDDSVLSPVLTLPFALMGLEFNWDVISDDLSSDAVRTNNLMADVSDRVYRVQEKRYEEEKIYTARTEHVLSESPFFVYDTIFANGYSWNTIAEDSKIYPDKAIVATKAVFPMFVLWDTAYTNKLMLVIEELYDEKLGWYEGRYERTGGYEDVISASTNAIVMESLWYKVNGKLFSNTNDTLHGVIRMEDVFKHPGKCFPSLYKNTIPSSEADTEPAVMSAPEDVSGNVKNLEKVLNE
ncbi:hypothetical protein A9Q99_00395 [Gammaproteobacteria bacterium 45_16_T64]|nr:hypothetical protein A9Q99_00395 [Gammaproteobacteria bacterium 45_16_T64]